MRRPVGQDILTVQNLYYLLLDKLSISSISLSCEPVAFRWRLGGSGASGLTCLERSLNPKYSIFNCLPRVDGTQLVRKVLLDRLRVLNDGKVGAGGRVVGSLLHFTLHTSSFGYQVMKHGLKQQLILKIKSFVMEGESISFHLSLSPSPSSFSLKSVNFASLTPFSHYSSLVMRANSFAESGFYEKGISQGL